MTVLLGLHGPRGAGKDTAFGFVQEWAAERGVSTHRRGFADSLKLSFARLFIPNISLEEAIIWCDELKSELSRSRLSISWQSGFQALGDTETTVTHTINGRQALQRYGTEGHRDVFADDFWVDALLPTSTIEGEDDAYRIPAWPYNFRGPLSVEPPEICVIPDTRFVNEARRIKLLKGTILGIVRPGLENSDGHTSEIPLPDEYIDGALTNHEGSPDLMRPQVWDWMEKLYARD